MKSKWINIIKYSKILYVLYFYFASLVINILKIFIRQDKKLIIFNSFAGRKYDDSPKEMFLQMQKDFRFKDFDFVWAFHEPDKIHLTGARKIKTDTFQYFITVLKARAWITNSSMERGLNFKGKNTFYFNTWHGTPIKLMGSDVVGKNQIFTGKAMPKFDIMCSQGRFETEIFSRAFNLSKEKFLECGLPRNDVLTHYSDSEKLRIKRSLGIEELKKVILYAPTFREYEQDENKGCVLLPPMDLNKWKQELQEKYVLLFRAHYEVVRVMNIENDGFVYDMTKYPTLNDLIIIADILISDYSSIFFDYSITGKPMFHFTYDYQKYVTYRGMYFDIRKQISGASTEDELLEIIKKMNEQKECERTRGFREKYVNFYGNATRQAIDCLAENIINKKQPGKIEQ